jgi:hypothetical protein
MAAGAEEHRTPWAAAPISAAGAAGILVAVAISAVVRISAAQLAAAVECILAARRASAADPRYLITLAAGPRYRGLRQGQAPVVNDRLRSTAIPAAGLH